MKIIPKSILKKVVMLVVILFALIQFIPKPKKNINDSISIASIDELYSVPDAVKHLMKVACYDCHSNNTQYPWYSNLQPVAWFLNYHIADGKKELNFDEYMRRNQCPQHDILCEDTGVWFTQNMLLGPRSDMDYIASAIERIRENAEALKKNNGG